MFLFGLFNNTILRQGYNGSQLWDTAFAVQALAATKLPDECGTMLKKANTYINESQVWDSGELLLPKKFVSVRISIIT